MRKKYFITGGCGFLGANLAAEVIKRNHELVIFDNLSRVGSEHNLVWLKTLGDFIFHYGDIRNSNDVTRAIKTHKPDTIFHLAGQVAMTISIDNPLNDFLINGHGTVNLLLAVKDHCPESTILYSSTNKVYGNLEQYGYLETDTRYVCKQYLEGYDETVNLSFESPYGCSKGIADQYMLDFHRIYGLRTVVFRHSSICGTRQFCTEHQGWVGWFVQQALATLRNPEHQFEISGTGKQVRDVLFAPDLLRCYFMANDEIEKCTGQAFNIGGGFDNSLSIIELFDYLEKTFSIKLNIKKLPWRQSDQKIFIANTAKAKQYFGWQPAVSKWDGLLQVINWTKQSETDRIQHYSTSLS
jgi:CDP-paratose 2-epimerase